MRPMIIVALLAVTGAVPALAQSPADRLIAAARAQIEDLNGDSAVVLLEAALNERSGATATERIRGLTLYGIAQLSRANQDRVAASQAFVIALRLDNALRIDSLFDLQSDVASVFAEARRQVPLIVAAQPPPGPRPTLGLTLTVPADTVVSVTDGRVRVQAMPTYRSRVIFSVVAVGTAGPVLWSDSATVLGSFTTGWNLRLPAGGLVAEGRYVMRVQARDSLNQLSLPIERIVVVSRVPADTQPLPAPLDASTLLPETLTLRRGSPAVLALGLGLGAAAAMLPTALGNTQLNSGQTGDGTAIAVAGVVSLAGVVGWLRGSRTRAAPENATRNAETRRADAQRRADIATRNRAALQAAPVRVRVEP